MEFSANLLNSKRFTFPLFKENNRMAQEELYSYPLTGNTEDAAPSKSLNFSFLSQTKCHPTFAMPTIGLSVRLMPTPPKLEDLKKNMLSYVVGGFVGSKSQQNKEKSEPFPIGDLIVHLLEEKKRAPPKSSQAFNLVEDVVSNIMRGFGVEVPESNGKVPSPGPNSPSLCAVGATALRLLSECSIDSNESDYIQFGFDCDDVLETEDDNECFCGMVNTPCTCDAESSTSDEDDCDVAPADATFTCNDEIFDDFSFGTGICNLDIQDSNCDLEEDGKVKEACARWNAFYGSSPPTDADSVCSKVRFNPLPSVRVMRVWDHAYREARKGPWEEAGRDRCRFAQRVSRSEEILAPILTAEHRSKIWNALEYPNGD